MEFEEVRQEDGSIRVRLDTKPLACLVCGNDRFKRRSSLLNTRGGQFLGVGWAEDKATNYVCTNCGHILLFLARKKDLPALEELPGVVKKIFKDKGKTGH
jgi:DNA-directed RNA polymerase subunit RPC12/RpoP